MRPCLGSKCIITVSPPKLFKIAGQDRRQAARVAAGLPLSQSPVSSPLVLSGLLPEARPCVTLAQEKRAEPLPRESVPCVQADRHPGPVSPSACRACAPTETTRIAALV